MTCGNPSPEALILPFHVWVSLPCHSETKVGFGSKQLRFTTWQNVW